MCKQSWPLMQSSGALHDWDSKGPKVQWHVFLQVAQAVSTRVDILSPEYLIEIERLQDDVAPFPTVQVHTMLR